jgi:hypothetical protein
MAHQSTSMPRTGWLVENLVRPQQNMSDSAFLEDGPAQFITPAFWIGGLASLAVWTGIWTSIAWLLDRI